MAWADQATRGPFPLVRLKRQQQDRPAGAETPVGVLPDGWVESLVGEPGKVIPRVMLYFVSSQRDAVALDAILERHNAWIESQGPEIPGAARVADDDRAAAAAAAVSRLTLPERNDE